MSYKLQALLAKREVVEAHPMEFQSVRLITLAQGITMIPLTDALCDEIGENNPYDGFFKLSAAMEQFALSVSRGGLVFYVAAEFFGGVGEQSAIAWSQEKRVRSTSVCAKWG